MRGRSRSNPLRHYERHGLLRLRPRNDNKNMTNSSSSIEDLLGNKKKKPSKPGEETVQEKFDVRILEITDKQRETEAQKMARDLSVDYINLVGFSISADAISLIPQAEAQKSQVVSFLYMPGEVRLAALNPQAPEVIQLQNNIAEKTRANVKIYLCSQKSLSTALKFYENLPEIKEIIKGVAISEEDLNKFRNLVTSLGELKEYVKKTNVTDFLAMIIASAIDTDASDIHIEAEERAVVVRFRIDGTLNNVAEVDSKTWSRIINRVKLVSGLKISITSAPQDGRFTIFMGGTDKIDVRVSTLPTAYGESVVMRILKPGSIAVSFEGLGLRDAAFRQLKAQIERPNGMIVSTGPTGSGKTTTQYAILKKLNNPNSKLITLEDPVEYKLEGVNQSQIDKSKDYTFAKGLVSILRQDPDVIMVGEIRDLDTAEVAIQAALTGHILLSTVHTNSAAGAIPRLLSMGVKPFLLAPALNAVIGQRLVRKIHVDCKEVTTLEKDQLEKAKKILAALSPDPSYKFDLNNLVFYQGKGCATCNNTGFKGRIGIYEIFTMSPAIEKIILSGAVSEYQMQDVAIEQGMVTMAQDGLLKAIEGITSVAEVFSVAE